jgi:hypothetical protein
MGNVVDWVPFEEGEYLVERGVVLAADESAVALEDAYISVAQGTGGRRHLSGSCRIRNVLLVKMLDDHDKVDLALDLGGAFKYLMEGPELKGGKVFSPEVKSTFQFTPTRPWKQIPEKEFDALWARIRFVTV